jgi:hypothetical protein
MHPRHGVIEDNGFDLLGGKDLQASGAIFGCEDAISGTLQQQLADLQTDEFVVHAKDEVRFLFHESPQNSDFQELLLSIRMYSLFSLGIHDSASYDSSYVRKLMTGLR